MTEDPGRIARIRELASIGLSYSAGTHLPEKEQALREIYVVATHEQPKTLEEAIAQTDAFLKARQE